MAGNAPSGLSFDWSSNSSTKRFSLVRAVAGANARANSAHFSPVQPGFVFDPSALARFLCGITSPALTRAKLSSHALFGSLAHVPIRDDLDYHAIAGLSTEMVQRLTAARPATLGDAERIPGITPAALSALLVHNRSGAHR